MKQWRLIIWIEPCNPLYEIHLIQPVVHFSKGLIDLVFYSLSSLLDLCLEPFAGFLFHCHPLRVIEGITSPSETHTMLSHTPMTVVTLHSPHQWKCDTALLSVTFAQAGHIGCIGCCITIINSFLLFIARVFHCYFMTFRHDKRHLYNIKVNTHIIAYRWVLNTPGVVYFCITQHWLLVIQRSKWD